jgi:DNA-binding transcriptional ArsR family regulator
MVRKLIALRYSPLLDLALSVLVIQNPERFGTGAPWVSRVLKRLPAGLTDQLREVSDRLDLFSVALELETGQAVPVPELLERLRERDPAAAMTLLAYWEAIAPEVADRAGVLIGSVQEETARLGQMDPLAFICRFSDRVSVAGDGDAIILHWGKGMQVPLSDLERILFIPSAFSPRRLMFYRLDRVQIFFYAPLPSQPEEVEEPSESLTLVIEALADATRLKLLRLIARANLPAQEMAERLGVNESTVSRHLRLLVEAGLVGRERTEGKYIFYSFQRERVERLAAHLGAYLGRERGGWR